MALHHSLNGLTLSADFSIPGLPVTHDSPTRGIEVRLRANSSTPTSIFSLTPEIFYISPNLNDDGQPVVRVGRLGEHFLGFFYSDGARFAVRRDGREIWVDGPANYALEDLATYLVGPVMGFVLRLFGILPLHACAVAVQGKAIVIMGPPGAGKSTTAAAFAKLGFGVLAEDVVAVAEAGERLLVQPGYPRVNLWPESAESLFGAVHGLPPVTPTWGKHFLSLDDAPHRFQHAPLELGAIFVLRDRVAGAAKPRIEKVFAASAMPTLVANTYVNYLLDSRMRRTEFVQLGRLLQMTPVYQVWPSDDASRVYDLCDSIAAEAQGSTSCAALP